MEELGMNPSSSSAPPAEEEVLTDEEEEVLIEPRFKYGRVLNDLSKVFEVDDASCIAVHDKFIAIGGASGRVYLFDHLGNSHLECTARHHKCAVNSIAIDRQGNYFVSCANDFSISIFGIGCEEYNQRILLKTSAKVVAIAQNFSINGSGQKFVVGERNLVLYERNFLGRRKSTVIYRGMERDGFISSVSWHSAYIAFTNDSGTRIYDCRISKTVTLIQPKHNVELSQQLRLAPHHCWLSSTMLAVGWANTICVCDTTPKKSDNTMYKHPKLIYQWNTQNLNITGLSFTFHPNADESSQLLDGSNSSAIFDASKCGENDFQQGQMSQLDGSQMSEHSSFSQSFIADHKWSELVVLGVRSPTDADDVQVCDIPVETVSDADKGFVDQLLLLRPSSTTSYELIVEDTIKMRRSEKQKLIFSTLLGALPNDNVYFLMSAKELIEAHPCSTDDRIRWLLENELYFDAFDCALKNPDQLEEVSITDVGKQLIHRLVEEGKFDVAAKYLPVICARQKDEWEYYVNLFEEKHQVLKLVPVIPISDLQLEPECYETILMVALYSSPSLFRALVFQWNADLYRVGSIINETIKRMARDYKKKVDANSGGDGGADQLLSKEDGNSLYKVLAHLYVYKRDFNRAIDIYLILRDSAVFSVIERHSLFGVVQNRIIELMEINTDLTIRLLLDNENEMDSQRVVKLLSKHPKLQIAYLNRLLNRGEGAEYSDMLVRLYAEHDRPKLLPFLRKSENYKLDYALDICKRRNLVEEKIFLLGRSGNRLEALEEIINNLGRIEFAIEFCKEHGDDLELWDRLIELSMNKPSHISALLSATGTFIDNPLSVVEKIPPKMEITGLKNSLLKVLRDSEAQINLLQNSLNVGYHDITELFKSRVTSFVGCVDISDACVVCSGPCFNVDSSIGADELRIFFCGHIIHPKCLEKRLANSSNDDDNRNLSDLSCRIGGFADVCPLCFERQVASGSSFEKSSRQRATTLIPSGTPVFSGPLHHSTSSARITDNSYSNNPFM